jgi:FkbM family methyltransferase
VKFQAILRRFLMNLVSKIIKTLQFVASHPVNQGREFRAVMEYGFIQMAVRMVPCELCLEFPNRTRLTVSPRMKGAAHFIAPRLCEFNDMAFVMHFMRHGEMFVDVGANIGAFTVLAAGVAGANAVSFEPSIDTFEVLTRNIRLNALSDRVRLVNAAVGRSTGVTRFSAGLGTENHVSSTTEIENSVEVKVTTLDQELGDTSATLLKVDVEGFETEVFNGAGNTIRNNSLQAIIVERAGSGNRYGYNEEALHAQIRELGFKPHGYMPVSRQLMPLEENAEGNIIYLRDTKSAAERLRNAPAFKLGRLIV